MIIENYEKQDREMHLQNALNSTPTDELMSLKYALSVHNIEEEKTAIWMQRINKAIQHKKGDFEN